MTSSYVSKHHLKRWTEGWLYDQQSSDSETLTLPLNAYSNCFPKFYNAFKENAGVDWRMRSSINMLCAQATLTPQGVQRSTKTLLQELL